MASKPPESCWSVKIADFGIAKRIPPERIWNFTPQRGTPYYNAPEVVGWIDPCRESPGALDLWSLGVIVYSLATKQFPFAPRDLKLFCCDDGKFPFPGRPVLERWSDEGLAFVEALLRPLPRQRLSAEDALQHTWITTRREEQMDPPLLLTSPASMLSLTSVDGAESGFVHANQITASGDGSNMSLVLPAKLQAPPSTPSNVSWPRLLQTESCAYDEIPHWLTSPLVHPGASYPRVAFPPSVNETPARYSEPPSSFDSPRALSPVRMISAPISYPDGTSQASFSEFTPLQSAIGSVQPGGARLKLNRRATAPTPISPVWDAIDRISPRTKHAEVTGSFLIEQSSEFSHPDSTSPSLAARLSGPLNLPPSLPPQNSSLVWRDTRVKSCLGSKSVSFGLPNYKSDQADRGWRRDSALEYINDPRFINNVHALRKAIQDSRCDVVDMLIDQRFDIETVIRDPPHFQHGTPLHFAIRYGQAEVVETLLHRGASVKAKARAELSNFHMRLLEPLHLAAYYGLDEIARMLLAHGARIEANAIGHFTKKEKRTPLHLAVLGEDFEEVPRMVRLLLKHGADANVKDDIGMRPGDYAVVLGQKGLKADLPSSPAPKAPGHGGQDASRAGPSRPGGSFDFRSCGNCNGYEMT